jgi:hypothetical protein
VQQAQRVGHCDTTLAQPLSQAVLGQAMLVDELAERHRFLERVEVAALDVLDQRHLQAGLRGGLFDDRRQRAQSR